MASDLQIHCADANMRLSQSLELDGSLRVKRKHRNTFERLDMCLQTGIGDQHLLRRIRLRCTS